MKRFFTLALGALALVAVALVSAFIAMRLAIHGREAVVPELSGLTVVAASSVAAHQGLAVRVENSFYSADVPAGRVLTQDPAAGSRVRREWPVRITESLGAQRVQIPGLTGETERAATLGIRHLSLELGVVARLASVGDAGIVLAQTPLANAGEVDSPRVSLLVSDAEITQPPAYAMPSLVGLSISVARARAQTAGLSLIADAQSAPSSVASNGASTPIPPAAAGNVAEQSPQAGSRVVQGDIVHVTLGHSASPAAVPVPAQ